MNYSWHPDYGHVDFMEALDILKKFTSNLSKHTSDFPHQHIPESQQLAELIISNKNHPQNHAEYYGWISMTQKDEWWLTNEELHLLNKYGWKISYKE
jgi:hypothetical protein